MWQNTRQNNLWFYTDCLTLYHDTWVHQMILHRLPQTVPWYMGASNDSTQTASHCTMIHGCIKWFYTDCLTLYHDTWVHQMILHRLPHTVPWYMGASNDSTQTASHCTMIHGCIKWFYTDCLTLYHDTWVHQMILLRLPHAVPWYMGASNDSTQTASHCTMIHGCIKWFYTDCLTLYHDTWVHQRSCHRVHYACAYQYLFWSQDISTYPRIYSRSQASPVFCSSVCVQHNTQKRKSAKNGEGLGTPIMSMTSGGREMDVGGRGPHSNTWITY